MHSFCLTIPQEKVIPIVASIPHSGMYIPMHTAQYFNAHHLSTLRNTDWHIDALFNFLPSLGIQTLKANFSRYVIDVNRDLHAPLFGPYNSSPVYHKNTWGEEIYNQCPPESDILDRVKLYYRPYHQALTKVLLEATKNYGTVLLLDLHSFMGPITNDVCLGDYHGKSCHPAFTELFFDVFDDAGYNAVVNQPFSGGHIVKYYSTFPSIHSLQIEMRYTTYLSGQDFDSGVIPEAGCEQFCLAQKNLKQLFTDLIPRLISLQSSL